MLRFMPLFPFIARKPAEDGHGEDSNSEFSYHSSIRGTHDGAEDRHFASYCPVSLARSDAAIYASSLMALGNGWAPLELAGIEGGPRKHFEQGVTPGDVGYLSKSGGFNYLFNIFSAKDDPMQTKNVPRNFVPMVPPLAEWEIKKVPNHFAPHTVIVSEGIQFNQTSDSPWEIAFSSSAREGAVVVLPTGASREDLADTSKLHSYLKEHAVDWYQSLNLYSGSENILPSPPGMNGTLFIVTGCDRATSCATVVFPATPAEAGMLHTFRYNDAADYPWFRPAPAPSSTVVSESRQPGSHYSIFIRGITIALGTASWTRHLPHIPEEEIPVYDVLAKPLFEPQDRLGKLLERLKGLDKLFYPVKRDKIMFHPAMALIQVMIECSPSADVAIVDDSSWCPLLNGRNLTHPEIVELLHKVIHDHDLSVADGLATLMKKPEQSQSLVCGLRGVVGILLLILTLR
ncbi:hypothetical protein NLJ89_g2239 [Agrocybe chaxingu]|uniref:Uncharacterized protein n=1 Tax=Agrocybe chaxingu TaxID=84603 RepID=A0A9W8KBC3_9AGAR|nr:hypothetical protein NLJ89_g2239 [Agrocybe chaxingu]